MTEKADWITADRLDRDDFERHYYRGNRPLVIRGAVNHWPALGRWSREYFESLFGDRRVPIDYNRSGFLTYTALDDKDPVQRKELPFREAAAEICTPDPTHRRCYLRNISLPDYFPELMQDYEPPALIGDPGRITMIHFWYGAPGCVTALHFDWTSNFLVQVQGCKQVLLFAPSQTPFLYPAGAGPVHERGIDLSEHSLLNPEQPDYERFPLFRQARPLLAPGWNPAICSGCPRTGGIRCARWR